MKLSILILILSTYVAWESFDPICAMPAGLVDFCHKAKYVLALGSSLAFSYYAAIDVLQQLQLMTPIEHITHEIRWLAFGSAGTMALFVWPRTVWKLHRLLDDMESSYDYS